MCRSASVAWQPGEWCDLGRQLGASVRLRRIRPNSSSKDSNGPKALEPEPQSDPSPTGGSAQHTKRTSFLTRFHLLYRLGYIFFVLPAFCSSSDHRRLEKSIAMIRSLWITLFSRDQRPDIPCSTNAAPLLEITKAKLLTAYEYSLGLRSEPHSFMDWAGFPDSPEQDHQV